MAQCYHYSQVAVPLSHRRSNVARVRDGLPRLQIRFRTYTSRVQSVPGRLSCCKSWVLCPNLARRPCHVLWQLTHRLGSANQNSELLHAFSSTSSSLPAASHGFWACSVTKKSASVAPALRSDMLTNASVHVLNRRFLCVDTI